MAKDVQLEDVNLKWSSAGNIVRGTERSKTHIGQKRWGCCSGESELEMDLGRLYQAGN